MVGPMVIVDAGDEIDLSRMGSGGWSVPSITEDYVIQFKKSEAKYVLLVEKEAVWHRLNEDKFWRKHKCLLAHRRRPGDARRAPAAAALDARAQDPGVRAGRQRSVGSLHLLGGQAGLDHAGVRIDAHGRAAKRDFSASAPATSSASSCRTTSRSSS